MCAREEDNSLQNVTLFAPLLPFLSKHDGSVRRGHTLAPIQPAVCRYQFISLAYFLMKLVYPERYGRDDEPSLLIPHQYGALTQYMWETYYKVRW